MHKEKFMIYRRDAKKGEATYSPKSHSAPHFEGHYVEGMEEWASWYCFNKKEDGTYEAELDEAWNEGSHNGGGTINVDIPKEWFALSYVDFLEHVITLAAAKHYGFTVDDLKERKGLKQFFGFKDSINLIRLSEEHTIAFKEEMQEVFQHGFMAYYKDDNQWEVLPDKDFYQSLEAEGAEAYEAVTEDGQRVGGAEIEVWETCTPYFDRRNIHFYINRCGFHAVEFFNEHHPDPNMPEQFDQEDGLFKFEKRMR